MQIRQKRQKQVQGKHLAENIIIDTHGGEQDIIGIVVSLKLAAKHGINILGITVCNGRRNVDEGATDALLAVIISQMKVPIYKGARKSILLKTKYHECHNFNNDFSKLDLFKQQFLTKHHQEHIQEQFAPIFISQQIEKYGENLSIITFGPLTNLALAYNRNQSLTRLSSIRINGGNYTGCGNVIHKFAAEGNFFADPQAAAIVVANLKDIYINPIESTLEESWRQVLVQIQQRKQTFPKQYGMLFGLLLEKECCNYGPLMTILPAFHHETLQSYLHVYAEVLRQGFNSRGMMAINWFRMGVSETEQQPNVKIYCKKDMELKKLIFKEIL